MPFFHEYPYESFHEMNLDWIIKMIKKLTGEMHDFKVINMITWGGLHDPGKEYPCWCIVDTPSHEGYISIKPVPVGVTITNTDYWRQIANYSALYADFQNRLIALETTVGDASSGLVKDVNDLETVVGDASSGLVKAVNDVNSRIDTLIATHRHILYVTPGATPSEPFTFTTITAAVNYATQFCSKTNRVLIIIAPGTYNESIRLHPNPGIDMIGYGATIYNATDDYPNAALFTTDTGYFEGLTFSSRADTYGVHVEKKDITTDYSGEINFINCTFIARGHNRAAFGCGMAAGQTLRLDGCKFDCNGSSNTQGAFYIHNAQSENQGTMSTQYVYVYNCHVVYSQSWDMVITDACNYFGYNETSIMNMYFRNCTGFTNKVRFNTTQGRAQDHYLIDTNNIRLTVCENNTLPALMKEFPYTLRGYFGVITGDSGSLFVNTPIEASSIQVDGITTKNNVDGSRAVSLSNIVSQDDYIIGIVNAVPAANCYGSYNLTCEPI